MTISISVVQRTGRVLDKPGALAITHGALRPATLTTLLGSVGGSLRARTAHGTTRRREVNAFTALQEFRDEHVRIVALYILIPSRKAHSGESSHGGPKGTGGTDAFQFVKGVRDQTAGALLGRPRVDSVTVRG